MWNELTVKDNDDRLKEGVVTRKQLVKQIFTNVELENSMRIDVLMHQPIDTEQIYFILQHGLSSSGNSYIVSTRLGANRVTTRVVESGKSEKTLGFALSVPHTLWVESEKVEIRTGLTTQLCVSVDHRNNDLARYLITSIIDYGFHNDIYTGYHYIATPRTVSNVHVYTYFRPLKVSSAIEFGYEVPFHGTNYEVTLNTDYSVRDLKFEDLELCRRVGRKLTVSVNKVEFENLMADSEGITILYKSKVVGVCIYRTVLLHTKKDKVCPIGRVVLMEMIDRHTHHVVSSIINYLSSLNKYVVMSGVCFGSLNNRHIKNSLGFIVSGESYLDFYNLHLKNSSRNANEINLLYM